MPGLNDLEGVGSFTPGARRLGLSAAGGALLLIASYVVTLGLGMASLDSSRDPIGDPWFTVLEILIILLMPFLVALMVALHAWAPASAKVWGQLALVFMAMLATLTSSVHFVILTLGRTPEFALSGNSSMLLSFRWPSVAYALDILAWDGFFALAALSAAAVFSGTGLAAWTRRLLLISGGLALAGLSGVAFGDMRLRDIGIAGYAGTFPMAVVLMAILFAKTTPDRTDHTGAPLRSRPT